MFNSAVLVNVHCCYSRVHWTGNAQNADEEYACMIMEAVQTIAQPPPAVVRQHKTKVSIVSHIKEQLAAIPPIRSTISHHPQAAARESPETADIDSSQCSRPQSTNASTQTPATSILLTTKLFILSSKVHVAPSLLVQDELEKLWNESIRARLHACFIHEITRGTCVQELMMAGHRPDRLKPTIVVTCGDIKTRKLVQRVFKRQEGLQKMLKANGMLFVAAVEPTYLSSLTNSQRIGIGVGVGVGGLYAAGILAGFIVWELARRRRNHRVERLEREDGLAYPSQHAPMEQPSNRIINWLTGPQSLTKPSSPSVPASTAMVQIPTPTVTMQGSVTSLALEKNKATHEAMSCILDRNQDLDTLCGQQLTISESVNACTLGGVIVVDDCMYGMTAGHVFQLDHAYPALDSSSVITSGPNQHEELDGSDRTIDTEEAFWFGLESDDDLSQQVISDPEHINNNHPMQHAEEATADNADETRPVASSRPDQQFSGRYDFLNVFNKAIDQSDWALLYLPHTTLTFTNLKDPRNPQYRTAIVGTADDFAQGDVSVLFRDQSISGVLRKSKSTILCEGRAYDVCLVVLNDMLRKQGLFPLWGLC